MSDRDAFDGEIERLFGRPPALDDGEAFAAQVQRRLNGGWRVRVGVLSTAGVLGGFFAVREAIDAGIGAGLGQVSRQSGEATRAVTGGDLSGLLNMVTAGTGDGLAMNPSMPLFWLVSAGVIGAALFTALRSSQAN